MSKIKFNGKIGHRVSSYLALSNISMMVIWRKITKKSINSNWSVAFEIGVLFWRHQFNRAFSYPTIQEGRAYFDSLITSVEEDFDVTSSQPNKGQPRGEWHKLNGISSDYKILYLHGGGYAFRSEISRNFARMLAGLLEIEVFAPFYRLTPEHPHPAQLEDALVAYKFLINNGTEAKKITLIGDSAGGHLVLMLLLAIKQLNLPQPAIAICLSPWTDVEERGESFYGNDKYDLVQGYMAKQFGRWLQGNADYIPKSLSPIYQDFRNVAPIYMQAGEKEILFDMINEFALKLKKKNVNITLDIWPQMTHNFQFHGKNHPDSKDAFDRIQKVIIENM